MKKTLITLALALGSVAAAHASGTVFTAINDQGGAINLKDTTSDHCEARQRRDGFAWSYANTTGYNGRVGWRGCWRYDAGAKRVVVVWEDGDERTYPVKFWTPTDYYYATNK